MADGHLVRIVPNENSTCYLSAVVGAIVFTSVYAYFDRVHFRSRSVVGHMARVIKFIRSESNLTADKIVDSIDTLALLANRKVKEHELGDYRDASDICTSR